VLASLTLPARLYHASGRPVLAFSGVGLSLLTHPISRHELRELPDLPRLDFLGPVSAWAKENKKMEVTLTKCRVISSKPRKAPKVGFMQYVTIKDKDGVNESPVMVIAKKDRKVGEICDITLSLYKMEQDAGSEA